MIWQTTYPTADGLYWFWDGGDPTDDPPRHVPEIVQVRGAHYVRLGEGAIFERHDFPGYHAGPLVPPALTMGPPRSRRPLTLMDLERAGRIVIRD